MSYDSFVQYNEPLYRPPSEGDNLILQLTHGCSYNQCSFCTMYKEKIYYEKPLDEIKKEIDTFKKRFPYAHRFFFADGDALGISTETLLVILKYLKKNFPLFQRATAYASLQNLKIKTVDELRSLQKNGLKVIYFGIESGSDKILKKISKGTNQQELIDNLNKSSDSGLKISATVILGLGGRTYTKEHIEQTAKVINQTRLNYLSTLQLGLEDSQEEEFYKKFSEDFIWQSDEDMLLEQKHLISLINTPKRVIFRSNHASNALSLEGNLPKDKKRLIKEIEGVLQGEKSKVNS